ncbi:hypothetical protein [Actinomadura alba]|uniref:Uncharacterized protein n=1 Tax=Actinomadura alba TaxID=406431 RepID=A0ABR7LPC5_9ACTN|nr:hypothetical protein [Actinomadura alba]MBC6466671.1 hypothetical protein [Actinomadura alba]
MARTTQLRTYTIREGLLEEWAVPAGPGPYDVVRAFPCPRRRSGRAVRAIRRR